VLLAVIVSVLVLALNAARLGLEQPVSSGSVSVGQDYWLDGALDGSLTVMAQSITLGPQTAVSADAALLGDSVYLDGAISGDLTVISDSVTLGPQSAVGGDILLLADSVVLDGQLSGQVYARGARVTIQPGTRIMGSLYTCGDLTDQRANAVPPLPCDATALDLGSIPAATPELFTTVILALSATGSLVLGGLAVLAVTLFPRRVSHMAEAVRRRPGRLSRTGLALGLLLLGLSVVYLVLLAAVPLLGLLLLPLPLLLSMAFLGLAAGGWITLALLAGDALLRRLARAGFPPLVSAAVGSVALALGWNALLLLPYGGWLVLAALLVCGVVGMGAAASTRLGARALHESYFVQG
jgi:cytoskeletal protein CcmA (bactofilin family)